MGRSELDVEPGKLRELTADEVNALRLTAEGKMKPRRTRTELMLPKEAGRAPGKRGERPARPWRDKTAGKRFDAARGGAPGRGGKAFGQREERGQRTEWGPREQKFQGGREGGAGRGGERKEWKPREQAAGRFENAPRKPFRAQDERSFFKPDEGAKKRFEGERPPFKRDDEGKQRFEGERGKGFGKGAKFGTKAGGFGKFRGDAGRDQKRGFSRPGAQRGGWKRGSTRKPQS